MNISLDFVAGIICTLIDRNPDRKRFIYVGITERRERQGPTRDNMGDKSRDGEANSRVPIQMGEFSVMDTEFNNIKGRFDTEMKRMEEEMNRFRSDLISRQAETFRKTSTRY